jgi:hypothetical protein
VAITTTLSLKHAGCDRVQLAPGADQVSVGLKLINFRGPLFKDKNTKLQNTNLVTKVNTYLGPLPGIWKGPVQVKLKRLQLHKLHTQSAPEYVLNYQRL